MELSCDLALFRDDPLRWTRELTSTGLTHFLWKDVIKKREFGFEGVWKGQTPHSFGNAAHSVSTHQGSTSPYRRSTETGKQLAGKLQENRLSYVASLLHVQHQSLSFPSQEAGSGRGELHRTQPPLTLPFVKKKKKSITVLIPSISSSNHASPSSAPSPSSEPSSSSQNPNPQVHHGNRTVQPTSLN